MTRKIGPLRPIFNTPLKVAYQVWYETSGTLLENDQRPEFLLILQSERPQNWASGAHILHTSKSTCSEHVKQYWCETVNFLRKWPTTEFWLTLGPRKAHELVLWCHNIHISKNSFNTHLKQDWCEFRGSFFTKIFENLNFDLFGVPKWPKNLGLLGLSFAHLQS